jgi:hypothetical protein
MQIKLCPAYNWLDAYSIQQHYLVDMWKNTVTHIALATNVNENDIW